MKSRIRWVARLLRWMDRKRDGHHGIMAWQWELARNNQATRAAHYWDRGDL